MYHTYISYKIWSSFYSEIPSATAITLKNNNSGSDDGKKIIRTSISQERFRLNVLRCEQHMSKTNNNN